MGIGIGLALIGGATAVTAYGQYKSGRDQRKAARYNAEIQRQNAREAEKKAAHDALNQESQNRRITGAQRAAYGASGITMAGTPLDLMSDTVTQGELDRLSILHGGSVEAANYRAQARLSIMRGKAAASAGKIRAAGTLLGGAGKMYGQGLGN